MNQYPDARRSWSRWGQWLFLGLLLWLIVTKSLAGYLAGTDPELALRLNRSQPEAWLNIADEKLYEHRQKRVSETEPDRAASAPADQAAAHEFTADLKMPLSDVASKALELATGRLQEEGVASSETGEPFSSDAIGEIRSAALQAVRADPLNPRAFRILGQLSESQGDGAAARNFMDAAHRRSIRESVAVVWMLQESEKAKDWAAAARLADILFRTRPEAVPFASYMLVQLAEKKDAAGEVKQLLASNPPWRSHFFAYAVNSITDARTPLELLLHLRESPVPPAKEELKSYLDFLVAKKFYELAYYAWLQFLPPEELSKIGLIYNGDFERRLSGSPFDWSFDYGAGVAASIEERPDKPDQKALAIEFAHGRVDFRGAKQILMLAPGPYQMTGEYKGQLTARRGMVWRVSCAGSGVKLGESSMILGSGKPWKTFDFTFTVPDTDCRAQLLKLELDARSASETMVSGSLFFDTVALTRQQP